MSVVAAALRELIALGVEGEALVSAIERIEQAAVVERASTVRQAVGIATLRADEALAERKEQAAARTRRWRENKEAKTSGDVTVTHGDACDAAPPASPSFLPPRPPNQTTPTPPDVTTRARNGARLPEGWEPSERDRQDATEILGSPEAVTAELDKFRDYWRAVPGAKGRKLDWPATWRNWSRTAAERKPRQALRAVNVPGPDHKLAAKDANYTRAFAGADAAADFLAERRRSGF